MKRAFNSKNEHLKQLLRVLFHTGINEKYHPNGSFNDNCEKEPIRRSTSLKN